MFSWLKNVREKIKELNVSVDTYKKETDNQTMPSLAYVNRAKKLIEKSMYLEARDVLAKALSITTKDALVYKYLGMCDEKLGNPVSAIEMYKKSASINPQDKKIWLELGMLQVAMKDYESAERSFEQADKITPVNTDVQTGWGMTLFKQKKYDEALEKFTKALKINRYNFSALLLAAIVEIRLEKYEDARLKLDFLMKTNPTEGAAYEYAKLCYAKQNYDSAIAYSKKSIELNNGMLPAYLLLGRVYSIKFDYENSIKYFKIAEEKELIDNLLYIEWGLALVRLIRFAEAKEMFQKVLQNTPEDSAAKLGFALCCAELKDFKPIEEMQSEDDIFWIEAKGLYFLENGDVESAVNNFKTAISKDSKEVYNYYRLAKCYEKLGKVDMVKDSYDKLIKFCPEFIGGYLEYAKYLMSIDDYKDASRKLRKAEHLDNDNQEILNLLFYTSYILVKENLCEYNVKEAISLADKINEFNYPDLRADLEGLLKNIKESK